MNKVFLKSSSNLGIAIKSLGKNNLQFLIVTDKRKKMVGTITDGDIRRALIKGYKMSTSVRLVMNKKPKFSKINLSEKKYISLMERNKLKHLPLIDNKKRVVDIKTLDFFKTKKKLSNEVIIMVGGKGKRLFPLTNNFPKPMLPVNGKPILHHIVDKMKSMGFVNFTFITNFSSEIIKKYFQNGKKFQIKIDYIKEKKFLGTAGGLSLIKKKLNDDIILLNGDALTDLPILEMIKFHKDHNSHLTVATKIHNIKNPYGVVTTKGFEVKNFEEKPTVSSQINTGIYLMSQKIIKKIKRNQHLDMSDFLIRLLNEKKRVLAFPIYEDWEDAGNFDDFIKMNKKKNYFNKDKF